jgi:hypothetical protein
MLAERDIRPRRPYKHTSRTRACVERVDLRSGILAAKNGWVFARHVCNGTAEIGAEGRGSEGPCESCTWLVAPRQGVFLLCICRGGGRRYVEDIGLTI